MDMQPFTHKYRPSSISQIQGHNQATEQVLNFVKNYASQKKKGLLLHGAPGVGKTSLAYAVAGDLGMEVVEVNASDTRNKDAIETLVGAAMKQQSLFSTGKIILFDEIDGLSGTKDRGGIQALVDLMKKSSFPVILTANNPWDSKFSTLRRNVEIVGLNGLAYTSIAVVLKKVAEKEGIAYDEQALKTLARRAGGDLRGALTDLQTLGANKELLTEDLDALGERRQADTIQNALMRIFKGSDPQMAKESADSVDENLDELFLWIEENIPREYTQPADIERAFDRLSLAAVHKGRIMRWQYWRFLVYYIYEMTAGVSLAKEKKYTGFTKYQRTTRILKIWQAANARKKRDAIAEKIASKTHTSIKVARESAMPYFSQLLKHNANHCIVEVFEFAQEEIDWLVSKA